MKTETPEPDLKKIALEKFSVAMSKIKPVTKKKSDEYTFKNCVLPRVKAAGWQSRFLYKIGDFKNEKQQDVFNKCTETLTGVGAVIVLAGERGAGKTTLAAQIAIERTEKWWHWHSLQIEERAEKKHPSGIPKYRKLSDLIARYKPLYADFGSIETELLIERRDNFCRDNDLIVIDEVHDCDDQRMKDRVLTDMVDRCYAARNDVLLITNQMQDEFKKTTSDSILSRISEHGMIIECAWGSWRTKK